MHNSKNLTLREAGVTLIDCDHRTPPAVEFGYPYVTIPQMKEGRLDLASARRIEPAHFKEWTRKALPEANDVVLSRRCNPGETAYVPLGVEFALGQNLVLLRADGKKVYPPFLRWLVRGDEWWNQINKNLNVGAVFDSLRCADVPKFELTIPPLPEQRAIASVLGALDDKIESNRRTSRALERLARAIFRAWFVDFEPVKAKAAGASSFPGMPQEAFDALPSRLVESELGMVPESWEVGTMGAIGIQKRSQLQANRIAPGTAYIGLEHMPRHSIALSEWGTADSIESAKSEFEKGDILFGKLRPYFHKVGIAPLNGVCSTDIVVLSPKKTEAAAWLTMVVSSDEFVSHANQTSAGTKMPRTNWKDMANFPIVIPASIVRDAYQQLFEPVIGIIHHGISESHKLASFRDYILPKLLSGQVRVSDTKESLGVVSQ
ncbi:MAG: restriction endonuclease subunit S [Rectinemataceae bacterium]